MKANVPKDFEIMRDQRVKGYAKILEKAKARLPVKGHGYFVYECPKCERIYKMHLEKGVCQVDPNVYSILEEAQALKDKAKALAGVEIRMAGLPKMEDGFISVPEAFVCPNCEALAEKREDLAYAKHIFVGSKYESDEEYDITDGMNHFALSTTLGQGIPIIPNGADYLNRQSFFVQEAAKHATEKETMNYENPTSRECIENRPEENEAGGACNGDGED